jgi:xanthine permease XanP
MPRTPPDIVYDVDDLPPAPTLVTLGLQHVFVIAISLILPVLIAREVGLSDKEAAYFVSMSMLASGIGTCLQAWKYKGLIGSGFLCPCVCGPAYLSASVLAVKNGGLSLLFGMTALTGVFQVGLSRVIGRLRVLFPVEVTGVVVIMVGISIIPFTIPLFLSVGTTDPVVARNEILVAIVTFGIILSFTIWGKGLGRLFPALIGIVSGYILSAALGIIDISTYQAFDFAPLFAVPDLSYFGVSFSPALLIPFVVATICSSFKNVGDISICQKAGDLDWKRPEFSSISNGILSDGITTTVGGLLGGVGQSSSSSNIGLALATRAISRYIAFAAGGILIFLAFFPKIATVFLVMPPPVMGAALVYMGSFMIVAGFGILTSRMMDARKTFVIGVSLMFGIGAYILPDAFSHMDPLISPFFESGLALATILAICLNMIVRIGVGKEETLVLSASDPIAERVFAYMEMAGETFGARREVIAQASHAVSQTCDALIDFGLSKSDIRITTRFDDLNLDITIRYNGDTLPLPAHCPSENEILEDETAMVRLSGFLIRNYVDTIQSVCKNGDCTISIHYDH